MTAQIALQLYSLREVANAQGYEDTIRKVAAMGYQAVETAGFPGSTAEAAAKLFKELGLTVAAAHVGLPLGEKKNEILEALEALGKPRLVCTHIRPTDMESIDTIKAICDKLNESYAICKANGLEFGIHNHWWEFGELNGRLIHHIMLELLDPGIDFEIDTYWVKVAGCDPAKIVRDLGARAPLLHVKDGPGDKEHAMTAVGDGIMDFASIFKASGDIAKFWIVELDRCDTDVMAAVKKSYDYLAGLQK